MKVKVIGTIGLLFMLICAGKIVKTYAKDPEEAVFEGFLLASVAAYHAATLQSLKQEAARNNEDSEEEKPSVKTETSNASEMISEELPSSESASRAA